MSEYVHSRTSCTSFRSITIFALCISVGLFASRALAIDYDELVEQLLNQQQVLPLPLYVDEALVGELEVTLQGDTVLAFERDALLTILPVNSEVLRNLKTIGAPETDSDGSEHDESDLNELEGNKLESNELELNGLENDELNVDHADSSATITTEQLSTFGIRAKYDAVSLGVTLDIPTHLLGKKVITSRSIQSSHNPEKTEGNYSFFANLRYGQQYFATELNSTKSAQTTENIDLESAAAYSGWVVEAAGSWRNQRDEIADNNFATANDPAGDTPSESWRRSYTRVVTDSIALASRWQFGDLNYRAQNFQRVSPILGVSLASNQHIANDRVGRVTGGESFFLDDTSRVEVYVNSRLVRTLYLARGNYEVRDLPGVSGINDVRLVISNAQGEQQELNYSFVFSQTLLAKGSYDFSYNVGALRENHPSGNHYSEDWLLSAYHRYGVRANFTGGVNLQASEGHAMPGFNFQWAGSFGAFTGEYVKSFQDEADASATLLQYRYEKRSLGQLDVVWQFFEPNFSAPNTPIMLQGNTRKSQAFINIGKALGQRLVVNASYREGTARNNLPRSRSWELGLAGRLWQRLRVNAIASRNYSSQGNLQGEWEETEFRFDFSWQTLQPSQLFNAQYASRDERYRLNYSNALAFGQHQLASQLTTQQVRENLEDRHTAAVRYGNHRVESALSHEQFNSPTTDQTVTRAGMGTAIVMANNHWAVSRPVAGSFAVISTDTHLNGNAIGINPTYGGGYASKITRWSPAVISGVSPYYKQSVVINAEGTDLEFDATIRDISLLTNYREGASIVLQGNNKKIVQGVIINSENRPITFSAGEATNLSTGVAILFFTNESGEYLLEGVEPGDYGLTLFGQSQEPWVINIQTGADKRMTLPPLVLEK